MSYYSTIMRNGPTAYYRLSEASGLTASDASGNNNNGTYSGSGVTYGVPGAVPANNAVTFDGVAGICTCPAQIDPSVLAALTVEYWIKLSTTNLPSSPAIIANDLVGATNKGIVNFMNNNATALNCLLGNGAVPVTCSAGFAFQTGQWYHICTVWDGANARVYINGVRKGGPTAFAGPIAATAHNLTLAHNPSSTDFFTGSMDEFAFYPRALTADQVVAHYNARIPDVTRQYQIQGVQIWK